MHHKNMKNLSHNSFGTLFLKALSFSFLYLILNFSNAYAAPFLTVERGSYGCGGKIYLNVTGGAPNTPIYFQWTNSKGVWYPYITQLSVPGDFGNPNMARTDASGNAYAYPGNPSPAGYPLGSYPDSNGISTCVEDNYSTEYWYCGTYSVHVRINGVWSNTVSFSYNCECIENDTPSLSVSIPTCTVGAPAAIRVDFTPVVGSNLDIIERCQGSGCTNFSEVKKCGTQWMGGDPNCNRSWEDKSVIPGVWYRYRVRSYEGQCRMQYSKYSAIRDGMSGALPACTCATQYGEVDCAGFPVDSYRCTGGSGREKCDLKSSGLQCWHPSSSYDCDATCETCVGPAGGANCQVKTCAAFSGTFGDCTGNVGDEKCKNTASCPPSLERYQCQSMGSGTCPDCWVTFASCNGLTTGTSAVNGWCQINDGDCDETRGCGDGDCDSSSPYFETPGNCPTDCGGACGPVCGANGCESGETCSNCPGDCGVCPVLPCTGPTSVPALAVSWSEPLTAGVTLVRDDHFSELTAPINTLRTNAGMTAYPWGTCGSGGTGFNATAGSRISANLINCPRQALQQLYATCCANQGPLSAACTVPPGISGIVATGNPIRAKHVEDLRSAITSINFIKKP
jgi:hypothetical protein